jgi:1-acyl-sn-glycerol-3-phosphate acyltransferase
MSNIIINTRLKVRTGLLTYVLPLMVCFLLARGISFLIQKHHSFENAIYAFGIFIALSVVALFINFVISTLHTDRPWWVKFVFTLVFGLVFAPIYLILSPVGAIIIWIFPSYGCAVTSFHASVAMVTTGIFISPRGNINVIKKTKKAVVVINHRSSGDYPLAAGIFSFFENWRVMIGANLWKYRMLSWLFNAVGLPIVREDNRADDRSGAMFKAKHFLNTKSKAKIVSFPEGTRNRDDEVPLLEFKLGSFVIACAEGVPVIPIVVVGMNKWRRPGPKDTTSFVKRKAKFVLIESIKNLHKFPIVLFQKIKSALIMIFKEGINPTLVKVYYLDPVSSEGKTPKELRDEVWTIMNDTYKKYAYGLKIHRI